ncbi:MAG: glycosyltransferase family 39 protein [Chloroflexia bacterium]|nr:glycosyltransferase family 39 protein [Chloroflexia bacterium]
MVTEAAAGIVSWITGDSWNGPDRLHLIGRTLSALFDTLTVVTIYLLGRRVASWRVGLWAAAVAATAPMSIQLAHFFTTDSWLTCFVTLSLLAAIRAAESGAIRWFAWTGAGCGLAMATKGSVFSLAGVIGAAAVFHLVRNRGAGISVDARIKSIGVRLVVAAASAIAAFALFEPYALLNPEIYLQSLSTQAKIVSGSFDVPFTRQYVGTTPIAYQLEQLLRSGFGPVAGGLSLIGIGLLVKRFWAARTSAQWILLAWCFGYGLVVAIPETKFLRYLAPLIPVLAVTAGIAADDACRWAARRFGRRGSLALAGGIVACLGLWALAYASIFAHENSRIAASLWTYANAPSGSVLTAEYWDDSLPKDLGLGLNAVDRQYQSVTVDLYADAPPADVADRLYATLEQADYMVLSSNRVPTAVRQSPWRYPVQIRYFQMLNDGALGFERVAEFSRPPALAGLTFPDEGADESFINYDHPTVKIFQKQDLISRAAFNQAMAWATAQPWSPTREPTRPSLLLDEPVGSLPVVDDARWSSRWTSHSLAAAATWIALLALLQLAGRPIAGALFGGMADRGWGVSRLLAILIAGYLVWLGASAEIIAFRAIWACTALALVGGLGWLGVWRSRQKRIAVAEGDGSRPFAVSAEVVFWFVFGFFLLLRYLNPDSWHPLWGGEKPMELAHLNATLRSAHFPPYDPWFADGYLNYYYYGLYLVAFCLKLTGIPSEIGFNLAQPTIIALLASTTFGLASTLGRDITRRQRLALLAGFTGVLLMIGIGNLAPARQLLQVNRAPFDSFVAWTWNPSRAIGNAITEFPYFTALYADLHAHVVALPITILVVSLGYMVAIDDERTARVVFGAATLPDRLILFGRLALLMLLIGTLSATNAWDVPLYGAVAAAALFLATRSIVPAWKRFFVPALAVAGVALGAFLVFLPFHLHYVALFGSLERVRDATHLSEWGNHLGGLMMVVLVGLLVQLTTRSLLPSSPSRVFLVAAIGVGGATLFLTLRYQPEPGSEAFLARLIVVSIASLLGAATWISIEASDGFRRFWRLVVFAQIVPIVLALFSERLVLATFLTFALAASVVWFTFADVSSRFIAALLIGVCGVGVGTELVVIADDLIATDDYRMNTIFKFYNQLWALLALIGATLVAVVGNLAVPRQSMVSDPSDPSYQVGLLRPPAAIREPQPNLDQRDQRRLGEFGLCVTGLVVLLSLVYPLLATLPRLEQRFIDRLGSGTLNSLDWMDYGTLPVGGTVTETNLAFADDRAVIDWLNQQVEGSPVIAEASIGPYRCNGSRISINTGLPTIIGWERHEQQQRYPDQLPQRVEDVRWLYATPDVDEKVSILRRYNVEYVIVGSLERLGIEPSGNDCLATERADGIAAFDRMVGESLEVAFASNQTVLYRVLPPRSSS